MINIWFPTFILAEDISNQLSLDFNKKAYALAKKLQKKHSPNADWFCDTFNTMGVNLTDNNLFEGLKKAAEIQVRELAKAYNIDERYKIQLEDLWLNIAAPGDYQEFHTHEPNHFSCVYYVKTPKNCGNIIFKSLEAWANMDRLKIKEEGSASSFLCNYEPKEGLFLAFKSNLTHMVKKNNSNEDRCSIAMNFKFI